MWMQQMGRYLKTGLDPGAGVAFDPLAPGPPKLRAVRGLGGFGLLPAPGNAGGQLPPAGPRWKPEQGAPGLARLSGPTRRGFPFARKRVRKRPPPVPRGRSRGGFTMLELLVALAILVTALLIIWNTFSSTLRAWRRGGELLDNLHHGDFVMEQLVMAMRSAAFFDTAPHVYGFRLDSQGGRYPRDEISWVTSGSAFIPPDSPLLNGLYRITITVENNDDGDPAVAVRAYPHLAEVDEFDVDPWYVSTKVQGIDCKPYNFEDEYWDDVWEDTNSVPSLVEVTLFMEPLERYGDPVTLKRLVEIPIGPAVTSAVMNVRAPPEEEETEPGEEVAVEPSST